MPTNIPGAMPNIPALWPGNYKPASYATPKRSGGGGGGGGGGGASPSPKVREYDYVIVGGGTAGSVLANRLTADGKTTVLVLEAGYSDSRQLFSRIPAGYPFLFKKGADWDFMTPPQKDVNGRSMYWPRGKMLGGCSSMNALIYQRTSPKIFNEWAKENPGWDWDTLYPYFKKAESHAVDESYSHADSHGDAGPWKTRVSEYTNPLAHAVLAAADSFGCAKVQDINNPETQIGTTRLQIISNANGRRHSTAQAYLTRDVRRRPNLTIGVGAQITALRFEGGEAGGAADDKKKPRCVGVEFSRSKGSQAYEVRARNEVLLCAGSLNTPHLLMLSGVGPQSELDKHGIEAVKVLEGVGKNLQDHLNVAAVPFWQKKGSLEFVKHEIKAAPTFLKWLAGGGAMASNLAETAVFCRAEDILGKEDESVSLVPSGDDMPDFELIPIPVNALESALFKMPQKGTMTVLACHLNPTSKGEVTLASSSPFDKPVCDPRYLSTENDRRAMKAGARMVLKLMSQEPIQSEFVGGAYSFTAPKNLRRFKGKPKSYDEWSEEDLLDLCRETCFTLYHPVGTAKMGPASDPMAVVDSQLKVHGVEGLRVIDASVFPRIVRGHPQAATVAIAERMADVLLKRVPVPESAQVPVAATDAGANAASGKAESDVSDATAAVDEEKKRLAEAAVNSDATPAAAKVEVNGAAAAVNGDAAAKVEANGAAVNGHAAEAPVVAAAA